MAETLHALRTHAISLGIDVHHRHGEQKIREMIAEVEKENAYKQSDNAIAVALLDIAQDLLDGDDKPVDVAPVIPIVEAPAAPVAPVAPVSVRVKMRNEAGHELSVLTESVSEYKANGWRQV